MFDGEIIRKLANDYAVESVQTSISHEFLFMALIGHSLNNSNVYFGIGPALAEMKSNIYHIIGYADYNGNAGTNISGAPVDLSMSTWQWGWAAQTGLSYALNSSWFLDFTYTYTKIPNYTLKYVAPFTNTIAPENLIGTSYINPSQQLAVQSFGLTINKFF